MRTVRRGAIIGGTVVSAFIAVIVAVDCAQPTQIVIDVRADKNLCQDSTNVLSVGFGVTTVANVNDLAAPLGDFQTGCKDGANGIVGTETIKPSDDKTATIGIRIVAAVGGDPAACANDQSNCIISTRLITFQQGATVRETVSLSGACKGQVCGENQDCVAGRCVDRTAIQDDGGVEPDTGNPTEPEAAPPPIDTGIADTGPGDACAACGTWGIPGTATCNAGKCTIHCNDTHCTDTTVCGNGLDCTVLCDNSQACSKLSCGSNAASCSFNCNGGNDHCSSIACDASTCNVTCQGQPTGLTCSGVTTLGKANNILCDPTATETASCDNVSCQGDNCSRKCGTDAGGCGLVSACDGGCTKFEVFVPDAGP